MSKELSPEEQAAQESAAEASRQEEAIEGLPGSMIELAQKYPGLRKALGPLLTMGILATPAVAGAESKPRAAIIDTSESDEVRDQQDYQPVPTTVNEKALQKVKPHQERISYMGPLSGISQENKFFPALSLMILRYGKIVYSKGKELVSCIEW